MNFIRTNTFLLFTLLNFYCLSAISSEVNLSAEQCNESNTDQCWATADNLDAQSDYVGAQAYYQKLCTLNVARGCGRLGWSYWHGEGVDADISISQTYYKKGCDLAHGISCNNLGRMHEEKLIESADMKQANDLFEKACDLNQLLGCYNIGYNYIHGEGAKQDVKKGISFYTKACGLGDGDRCDDVGDHYDEIEAYQTALTFYKKGCALDSGYGCNRAAWSLDSDSNDDVKKDNTLANQFYLKGCELEFGASCNNLAREFMHWGEDIDPATKKDESRGLELFDLACTLESASGCTGAGYMYKNGVGVKVNQKQANKYFIEGCDALEEPDAASCYNMGIQYEGGFGVKKNRARAKHYYGKACELGDEDACESL